MDAICCANVGASRGGWPPCQSIWHEECFACLGQGTTPMRRIEDEHGNPWHNDKKKIYALNTGAKGVHCCATFQCEVCWMRNLEGRDLGPLNGAYIQSIRCATLDSISGKSRNTIAGHRRRNKRIV